MKISGLLDTVSTADEEIVITKKRRTAAALGALVMGEWNMICWDTGRKMLRERYAA